MKQKKMYGIISACILLLIAVSARIVYINRDAGYGMPKTVYYDFGETVPLGDNFQFHKVKADGYTARILDSQFYTAREAKEAFELSDHEEELPADGFCILHVLFTNEYNENVNKEGIAVFYLPLVSDDLIQLNLDEEIYGKLNPKIALGQFESFSLEKGTSLEVWIPYRIHDGNLAPPFVPDMDMFRKKKFYMKITSYPERKLLSISP